MRGSLLQRAREFMPMPRKTQEEVIRLVRIHEMQRCLNIMDQSGSDITLAKVRITKGGPELDIEPTKRYNW